MPEGDTLLQDTDWPVTSGRRMVDLVNNKQLVAVVKVGISSEIPLSMKCLEMFDSELSLCLFIFNPF